jgi:hypothetical protein
MNVIAWRQRSARQSRPARFTRPAHPRRVLFWQLKELRERLACNLIYGFHDGYQIRNRTYREPGALCVAGPADAIRRE